jgi:ketosteroid isomerase-like protein
MRVWNRFVATGLLCVCALVTGPATAKDDGQSAQDCFTPAFKSGNADAVSACYADDAIVWFPGGPMARGRAAIRDGFEGFFANATIKDIILTPLGHERMGDTMASWGTYAIRKIDKATGVETTGTGRYVDVSKKIGGRWLYIVDHPSDDPQAAAAP